MRRIQYFITGLAALGLMACQSVSKNDRVEDLLSKMTLEEKLGQMNQVSNPYLSTGTGESNDLNRGYDDQVRAGSIGSFLNVIGAEDTRRLQTIAVEETRLGIPLIFGFDVIHGFKTLFPIPLAEASSFDREAMKLSAHIAAVESAANGLHWTFAPMVDISRDPRWGRIMEGAGEDPYLGVQAAIARVNGFQGDNLSDSNTIAACAKHFLGYGAAMGGRDYAMADMSERMMRETYFPPFQAAVKAGVATFMSSFNTNGGVPASGDKWLFTDVLRNEWGFEGFVVSDWASVGELVYHGSAESPENAGAQGINAGIDMDMMANLYGQFGKKLLDEGKIHISQIDAMVRRILRVKEQLGLLDDPFRYCDVEKQEKLTLHPYHLATSRDVARKSIVLMKNDKMVLPLSKQRGCIALIGPLAADKDAPLGNWRGTANPNSAVSLLEGLKAAVNDQVEVVYAEGCKLTNNSNHQFFTQLDVNTTDRSGFPAAIAAAKKADVVVMALGESAYFCGECRSYADISLKGLQLELLKEIKKLGKPVVLTLFTGRPLVLTDVVNHTDAILNCWLLGSESGNAIADVLFGDYNPSGKLPASFPYHVGQIPVFYSQMTTGRPYNPDPNTFSSKYRDIPNEPLFPFGFGLSYTAFAYKGIKLDTDVLKPDGALKVVIEIENTGDYDGEEVVQLYVRDLVGNGVSRPILELKGFEKVMVAKGQSKKVEFTITPEDLAFWRLDKQFAPEAGLFQIFVGSSSNNLPLTEEFVFVD
ncbi:MAG: beta-glucosidase BglX [Breznakibacter sp.]|nr:beta-glucosidase BglX [Breznakibacter sp.]